LSELVGTILVERYRIDSLIARGGMANVYRGQDLRLDRTVAIKVIHRHLSQDETFRNKFFREAQLAARVAHPNLVNVYDQGTVAEIDFIVMEFVEGITLRDALKSHGAIGGTEAVSVITAVLSGLATAHSNGILHRDIKPENILLADDGRIKLSDFGLARDIGNQTDTGSLVGTVAYLSPELIRRGQALASSDIYAVGIVLFEMLTGNQPYLGKDAMQIAFQHATNRIQAPSTLISGISEELDAIVLWCTEPEAVNRPQSASELLRAIEKGGIATGRLRDVGENTVITQTTKLPDLIDNSFTQVINDEVNQSNQPTTRLGDFQAQQLQSSQLQQGNESQADSFDSSLPIARLGSRSRLPIVIISAVLAICLGISVGWWFSSGPGSLQTVPNVAGVSVAEAEKKLAPITNQFEQRNIFDASAPGTVVGTQPRSALPVPHGSKIVILVSKGPETLTVPKLSGLDLVSASAKIVAARFVVGTVSQRFSTAAPLGTVITSKPKPGSATKVGSSVDLVISLGQIPSVVAMQSSIAKATLTAAGLKIGKMSYEFSSSVAKGNVISFAPESNVMTQGSKIDLVISRGPQLVKMPVVIGETILAAQDLLQGLGLNVVIDTKWLSSQYGIKKVNGSSAKAGTELKVGDTVTIRSR
jgi:serine/threonine-protein kinase